MSAPHSTPRELARREELRWQQTAGLAVQPLPSVAENATETELLRATSPDHLRAIILRRERLAATTPPPVRVVRLHEPYAAMRAAEIGAMAVEYMTRKPEHDKLPAAWYLAMVARQDATRAAHFARLALGVS